jgi:hypothetical protein
MRRIRAPFLLLLQFLVVVLLVRVAPDKSAPNLPLGEETTYVTGPLDKEGYIDYETALNERLSKGITPEKNANVLIWKAIGPHPERDPISPEFFRWLGIEVPAERGDYFFSLQTYLRDRLQVDVDGRVAILQQQQPRVGQRPWTAKDFPHIAEWLKANEKPLALIVEATRLPEYYIPRISPKTEKGPGPLMKALLPGVQRCREVSAALVIRAQLHVGEGDFDRAWQDLLACHRLARLLARGGSFIESLVGVATEAIAIPGDVAWLDRAQPSAKQARDRLRDLQDLPPFPPLADKMDLSERIAFLDVLQLVRRRGSGVLMELEGPPPAKGSDREMVQDAAWIDWGPALRSHNRWYDRLAATLRVKDRAEREKQLGRIEQDLKALMQEAKDVQGFIGTLLAGKADKAVGKKISDILIGLAIPAYCRVQNAADRAEQVQANLYVAFALAAYRADHGHYPAKLDELAPEYLPVIPGDIFSGKALIYRPAEVGYLLYSVGENGKDDGGRGYDDPPGDDLSVRLPLPPWMPKK